MATGVRVGITLACTECKRRNYQTMKSKRNTPDHVEFQKESPWCGKHTPAPGDPLVARQTRSERRARRAAQAESRTANERAPRQQRGAQTPVRATPCAGAHYGRWSPRARPARQALRRRVLGRS